MRPRNSAEILVQGPHLCTRILVRAMIGLFPNALPVIRWVPWGQRTRISPLLCRLYQPRLAYVCDAGYYFTCNCVPEFEFQLQFPCDSPSTELSDFRQSARSGSQRECKQTIGPFIREEISRGLHKTRKKPFIRVRLT